MDILKPGESEYDRASTTFMRKGSPQIIYRPRTAREVAQAVIEARSRKDALSIKSGGHSNSGFSTNDGGSVIDLSHMSDITISDDKKSIFDVGAGATWIQVAQALTPHGMALTSGDTRSVGVGGLATGGGIGWMVRKYGLTIDSLISAEVVTADGAIIHTDRDSHPDLFWGIRGGGSNFGIVTRFRFAVQQEDTVYSGHLTYDLADLPALLVGWRDYMRTADTALTSILNILPSFGGNPPMCIVACCYSGDDETRAAQAIQPLKELGNLQKDGVSKKHYADVLEDAHPPQNMKIIVDNRFYEILGDDVLDAIKNAMQEKKDLILQIRSLGGAMNTIPAEQTAFAYRNSEALIVSPTFMSPSAAAGDAAAAQRAWESIAALGTGSYGNLLSESGPEVTARMYPADTYARLAKVKQTYDPQNIFTTNHNITPAS